MPYKTNTYSGRRSGGNFRRGSKPRYGGGARTSGRTGKSRKDYIDPSRLIKVARPAVEQEYVAQHTFNDFAVNDLIKNNLKNIGFITPSPIQDQTIPYALDGRDIIGVANTGTGKTAAFAIPLLHKVMSEQVRALVVAPTRELAQQIDNDFRSIAKGSKLKGAILIGGTGMGPQLRDLRAGPQVVVGTPGRIKDHLERGTLKLGGFSFVVLDEVDRMLDMGFVDDMQTILARLRPERQSLFFSATLDKRVTALIEGFSNDPITVSIKTSDTSDNVHQNVVYVNHHSEKLDKLHDLLIGGDIQKVIIFDETQRSVEKLSIELIQRGFKADAIHGGKSQGQRQRSLKKFKQNEIHALVATDVAARGIDVSDITHVINYSLPQSYDDYVHRIGRTGRAGKTGYALTFIEK